MVEHESLISVLMPTYNVSPFVEDAVRSILSQTYRNFELIIIDDCSSDNTYSILQKLAIEDQRIILERNTKNSKICVTLNKAWSLAKGDYIVRMDGDDISEPERLDILLTFLNNHQEIDLVGSQLISIREDGEILSYKEYLRTPAYINRGNRIASCVPHQWMARREVYEKLNGYRNLPYVEDYDFLLRGEKEGFKYANVEEFLYRLRIRSGNTGSSNGLKQRKAKEFVQAVNSDINENRENIEKDYQDYIASTSKELNRFEKAHSHLDIAVQSRNNLPKMMFHLLVGMCESKYIFKYMREAVYIRLLIKKENKKYPRKKSTASYNEGI